MLSFFVYNDYYRIQQSFVANTPDVCKMDDSKAREHFEASIPHTLVHLVAAGVGVTGRRLDMPKHVRNIARTEQEGELS